MNPSIPIWVPCLCAALAAGCKSQARVMPKADWDQHSAGQTFFQTHPDVTLATNPDLQLVAAIIAEARLAYGIDEKRVYIAGFSNGAFFAQFAAMALGNRIAAFASKSGGLVRCKNTDECTFSGTGSSCAARATQTDWCSCSGAEKPGPIATSGHKPAAYLVHAADDGTRPITFVCGPIPRQSRARAGVMRSSPACRDPVILI